MARPQVHRLSKLRTGGPSPSARLRMTGLFIALLAVMPAHAAEVIPPKPSAYFNDNARVVSPQASRSFNEKLAQFERETSNQIVVAVYRKMESDSDIADYTQRIAQSWGVGQGDRRNGAVLFVFVDDRKMHVQVGYGLEGVIPDITAYDITERNIKPRFRNNDYEGGLATGIQLLMQAARGEYKGSGKTVAEKGSGDAEVERPGCSLTLTVLFILLLIFLSSRRSKRRRGYRYSGRGGPFIGGWTGGGGGWSSGGWSSGGGGGGFSGFSGGGGSFGGGGAGSSW